MFKLIFDKLVSSCFLLFVKESQDKCITLRLSPPVGPKEEGGGGPVATYKITRKGTAGWRIPYAARAGWICSHYTGKCKYEMYN